VKFYGNVINFESPDSTNEYFLSDANIHFNNPLSVYDEADGRSRRKLLGNVTLQKTHSGVVGEFDLTDEATIKIASSIGVYPCVNGAVMKRDGGNIKECRIFCIDLSIIGNVDKSIEKLKQQ